MWWNNAQLKPYSICLWFECSAIWWDSIKQTRRLCRFQYKTCWWFALAAASLPRSFCLKWYWGLRFVGAASCQWIDNLDIGWTKPVTTQPVATAAEWKIPLRIGCNFPSGKLERGGFWLSVKRLNIEKNFFSSFGASRGMIQFLSSPQRTP